MARRKTYPGCLDRHGPSWRWRVSVDGQRHTEIFEDIEEFDDAKEKARKRYQQLEREAGRRALGLPGAIRVSEMLDQYEEDTLPTLAESTQVGYKVTLRAIRAFFVEKLGDPRISQVQAGHVDAFLTWRRTHDADGGKLVKKKHLSGRTVEKERAVLGRIFRIFERLGYRDGNPVRNTEVPKYDTREPVILSDRQYEALVKACGNRDDFLYLYAVVLGETGARCYSEALWLRWEDVKLEDGFLWIDSAYKGRRTKSGKGRWVPMTPLLRDAMRKHFAAYRFAQYGGEGTPWVFHHTTPRRKAKPGDRIKSLRRSFAAAVEKAKLPDEFVPHDLRHRRVTKWLAEEKSPVLVQEAVGHADITTTMRYSHLAREHLRALVDDEPPADREPDLEREGPAARRG